MTPLAAFITGISTGGLSCMAVQGGLLLGLFAQHRSSETETRRRWWALLLPVSAFLIAKIFAYTILGFGLGAVGSKLQLTSTISVWLQTFAGLVILITGIRIIFPQWLPWMAITPPASIRRFIRRQSKNDSWVAPAFLGLLTILIPCGTTIAMETAAVATGSAVQGAAILLAFTLGTAPLFFLVGILAKGATLVQRKLVWATAALVIGLGIYTLNGALVMIDSPYTIQNEIKALTWAFGGKEEAHTAATATITINVSGTGYSPDEVTVPAGRPVTFTLATGSSLGCASIFRIPKLKIEKTLQTETANILVTTFPSAGQYTFSCGMGMYTGIINAI